MNGIKEDRAHCRRQAPKANSDDRAMCVAVIIALEKTGRLSVPEEHMRGQRDGQRHLQNAGRG